MGELEKAQKEMQLHHPVVQRWNPALDRCFTKLQVNPFRLHEKYFLSGIPILDKFFQPTNPSTLLLQNDSKLVLLFPNKDASWWFTPHKTSALPNCRPWGFSVPAPLSRSANKNTYHTCVLRLLSPHSWQSRCSEKECKLPAAEEALFTAAWS